MYLSAGRQGLWLVQYLTGRRPLLLEDQAGQTFEQPVRPQAGRPLTRPTGGGVNGSLMVLLTFVCINAVSFCECRVSGYIVGFECIGFRLYSRHTGEHNVVSILG